MRSLQDLVVAAGCVSARPDSVISLIDIIEDPLVDAAKLVPIVQKDPGLTAGLLKLCNSPLYNFKRRIGTPHEALVMVGNLTFARLCFTLSLEPVLHRHLPAYNLDLDSLWQHSLGTAYGAAFLTKAAGRPALRDRAFTAGLLHDIGKLALDRELASPVEPGRGRGRRARHLDSSRSPVPVSLNSPSLSLETERGRTGFDHAQVGAALLDSWELPEQIVAAVRWHHDPQEAPHESGLALAVDVADRVDHVVAGLSTVGQLFDQWISDTFPDPAIPRAAIRCLAETMGAKHGNILSLAMSPCL